MKQTWIILGATSAMAQAFIRKQAEKKASFILCARNVEKCEATAEDARIRGAAEVTVVTFDARSPDTFEGILDAAKAVEGALNCAVFVGSMPEQSEIDADASLVDTTITDSLTGPAHFLTRLAPIMEERGTGTIVGISSVAGDRGRVTNYVYGAAKAGFTTYLSGLRNRLARSGVHVLTVKPGPVDTPMTYGKKMPAMTTPEAVANDIDRAIARKRNTIYTAKIWFVIMTIIRFIPEPIFKKMSF